MSSGWDRVIRPLLLLVAAASVVAFWFAISPASDSAFSIEATTDVVVVEPSCGDQLTWDLPPGWVVADNAPFEEPNAGKLPSMPLAEPVTVELAAGARAMVVREASGHWKVRLTPGSAFAGCRPAPPESLVVSVGGRRLPADPDGYTYQSVPGEGGGAASESGGAPTRPMLGSAPPLALRLCGRVVLGQLMSEGGGWGSASQPILHGARIEVRLMAPLTNQSLSVLVEEVGPGSIVDTHACMRAEATTPDASCAIKRPGPSAGFMYYPNSDGVMLVQVHRTAERIGVVPFGGVERPLRVTNWAIWVKSPVVQLIAAGLLLISALLQGLIAARDAWPRSVTQREPDPPAARVGEQTGKIEG